MTDEVTAEEIAQHYSAAMDSVSLLNNGKPKYMSNEEWTDTVSRNVEHLQIMVAKDFMADQDLDPLNAAISANSQEANQ